jgi:hypothetical protein
MGTGKWLWPNTQTTAAPTGDPVEMVYYDPIGEGKLRPEFVQPTPYGNVLINLREQTVNDLEKLAFDNSVAEGQMPSAGTAFRALAYLGSKAEESHKTQRYLYEQAHEQRARKLLIMAKRTWNQPRKVQAAGYNNRYGAMELDVADLDGGYAINVVQDSSRPKTLTEKLQAFQLALEGGLIDPKDPSARDYVLDMLGLQDIDPANHLQEEKAARDLEKLKAGIQPMTNPFERWEIPLRVTVEYLFTEEFEALPDETRNGILMWAQWLSEMLQVSRGAQLGAAPGVPPMGPAGGVPAGVGPGSAPAPNLKAGPGGQSPGHVLHQVPGADVSNSQVQMAAMREAADVIPNSPPPAA